MTTHTKHAIDIAGLTKTYGTRRGLIELNLNVERGEVFGYLGPNGAGKSTTIRLMLDLIRPTSGKVTVLGLDPRAEGVELRRKVGYLPGDFVTDGRQNVAAYLRFLATLRGGLPEGRLEQLADRLGLDRTAKIRTLSKGNRQKAGLVQAFMHQPEVLILDEPTSGLDPLSQQVFLELVTEAAARGTTVFMSSHIMSEVEQVADRVGIIRDGRLAAVDTVARLRDNAVRRFTADFAHPIALTDFAHLPGVSGLALDESHTTLTGHIAGSPDLLVKALAAHTLTGLAVTEPALEELFHTYYDGAEAAPTLNTVA